MRGGRCFRAVSTHKPTLFTSIFEQVQNPAAVWLFIRLNLALVSAFLIENITKYYPKLKGKIWASQGGTILPPAKNDKKIQSLCRTAGNEDKNGGLGPERCTGRRTRTYHRRGGWPLCQAVQVPG
jgi:hypothetical protein